MDKFDCVILVGGYGSRISKVTKNTPKPLIKITKNSFLQDLINNICKFNLNKIYLLGRYKGYKIKEKFNNSKNNFVKIEYLNEKKILDTGGALSLVKNKIKRNFILINGDTFFDINLNDFFQNGKENNKICTLALTKSKNYSEKLNNLKLNKKNIINFDHRSQYTNGGIYFFKKKIFKFIKSKKISLENKIIKNLIIKKKVCGKYYNNYFLDIGSYNSINYAKKTLKKLISKRAIFLDRDGVINYDYGYVNKIKNFHIRPGVFKALALLQKRYHIFIITNQAGIAKKKFSLIKFEKLQLYIKKKFALKKIYFDDVIYCPHHPNAKLKKYKKNCNFRKPNDGMIKYLNQKWNIIKKGSFVVGDQISDKELSKKCKLRFVFSRKNLYEDLKNSKIL